MGETVSPLERNVGYVVSLVREKPGKLTEYKLTKQTQLRHGKENPLGFDDAMYAVEEAERRGLVQARTRGFPYGDRMFYYFSSR